MDLDKIQLKFLVVLKREANRLLDLSFTSKLSEEDSKKLINYLKLLKSIQEQELAAMGNLTDEELEALSPK